jgi:hypothetical protein
MIVFADKDWPQIWRMDEATGMRVPVDKSLDDVVAQGVHEWMSKYGRQPTDVIFGRKAIGKLKEIMYRDHAIYDSEIKENKFMGLTFHKDYDAEGVELLTRDPR